MQAKDRARIDSQRHTPEGTPGDVDIGTEGIGQGNGPPAQSLVRQRPMKSEGRPQWESLKSSVRWVTDLGGITTPL